MYAVMKDYFWAKRVPYSADDEESVQGKVVVITGSNSGIGKAAALEMAKRGAIVVMACRDLEKGKNVLEEIKKKSGSSTVDLIGLDLADLSSVRKCASIIQSKYDHINVLIDNSGLAYTDGERRETKDGFEIHMGVNHLGHFLFTMLLLDLVKRKAPSRIVVTSSMSFQFAELDLGDLMLEKRGVAFGYENFGAYANSKLANMYFASALAKELKGTGVTTYSICPGSVRTNLMRNVKMGFLKRIITNASMYFSLSPEQGVETILYCALSKKCAHVSGKMHRFNNIWSGIPDAVLSDEEKERKLWDMSMSLVGLTKT